MKSLVFVGGSSEATRKYGNEIRLLLGKETHTRLWQDDLFELGQDTLESILNFRKDYDFAVLLFSADDLINRRGTQSFSPRDNILLVAMLSEVVTSSPSSEKKWLQ